MFSDSVLLPSYGNTRESLGELQKAAENSPQLHSTSRSPNLPLVFLYLNRNTVHIFYYLRKHEYIHWCSSSISHQLDLYKICLTQFK